MGGGDRDVKAAAMVGGDRGLKMEEAIRSAGGDTLKRNGAMINVVGLLTFKSMGDAQSVGAWKKKSDEAVAPQAADDGDLKEEEEGGILRLKKEAEAAWDLWFLTQSKRRKGREATATQQKKTLGTMVTQETAQAPGAGNKRKKVVKIKLRQDYVDHMAANPFTICADLSDEELARSAPEYREIYAAAKLLETKNRHYWNALIAQQKKFGYAEDEDEVTDDDEQEEEVKN